MPRRSPPPDPSAIERKRTGLLLVRKTFYLLLENSEGLRELAFDMRLTASDVVNNALREYVSRHRRLSRPPESAPPTRKSSALTSRKSSAPPKSQPRSTPRTRKNTTPPKGDA